VLRDSPCVSRDVICPYASNALTSLSAQQIAGPSDEKVNWIAAIVVK
jgi:hypothetical protein